MDFSRQEQLDAVSVARKAHAEIGILLSTARRVRSSQASHLDGLYDEVDKLTKGKSLLSTSDLTVHLVNSLIADAKRLVYGDVYLDRLKIFVPAGDNPLYPDVLISLRTLRQTLARFGSLLDTENGTYGAVGVQLDTIFAALEIARQDEERFFASNIPQDDDVQQDEPSEDNEDDEVADEGDEDEGDEDEEDDEERYVERVGEEEIKERLGGRLPSEKWLIGSRNDLLFNFRRLDQVPLPCYTPPEEGITFVKPSHD